MFKIDAHLDLAMNAMEWNRDLRQSINEINEREFHLKDKKDRGHATVSLDELRKGNIGLVVATQIARYVDSSNPLPGWHSPHQAWAQSQAQLAWYKTMEAESEMKMIKDLDALEAHVENWKVKAPNEILPIGYVLSLEGADSLISMEHLHQAHQYGLRAVGPAHYGPGRYANGTDSSGKLNQSGYELLKTMEELNIILDATHLCDDAFWDAMHFFKGTIWASHNNCRSLVDHNRQFSDEQLKILISRGAVIGAAMDAWMIVPGWDRAKSTPLNMQCSLERLIDHIDHICQIAGNTDHIGIGSDLDGAFGTEQCPIDIKTIADMDKLEMIMSQRGYTALDLKKFMHDNWLRILRQAWLQN